MVIIAKIDILDLKMMRFFIFYLKQHQIAEQSDLQLHRNPPRELEITSTVKEFSLRRGGLSYIAALTFHLTHKHQRRCLD